MAKRNRYPLGTFLKQFSTVGNTWPLCGGRTGMFARNAAVGMLIRYPMADINVLNAVTKSQ